MHRPRPVRRPYTPLSNVRAVASNLCAASTIAYLGAGLTFVTLAATPSAGRDLDRYELRKIEDGYLRFDRQTGELTLCRQVGAGWQCGPGTQAIWRLTRQLKALQDSHDELVKRWRKVENQLKYPAPPTGRQPDGDEAWQHAPQMAALQRWSVRFAAFIAEINRRLDQAQ